MAYFRSNDDSTAYPDCTGTLFEQIHTTRRQIESANPPALTVGVVMSSPAPPSGLDGATQRERAPYPAAALREAVTNAVVHRDYLRAGAEVAVKRFADRLVIANPGGLLPGVTSEALRRSPHRSERRGSPTRSLRPTPARSA